MPQRDPAADAHTIAARRVRNLAQLADDDIDNALDYETEDSPEQVYNAIRAELAKLAEQLTLALHPDTRIRWSYAPPGTRHDNSPLNRGYPTRAIAEQVRCDYGTDDTEIVCRLIGPWQPAPTPTENELYVIRNRQRDDIAKLENERDYWHDEAERLQAGRDNAIQQLAVAARERNELREQLARAEETKHDLLPPPATPMSDQEIRARAQDVGRCGSRCEPILAWKPMPCCALPSGHAGWHRDDDGAEWTELAQEPLVMPLPPRVPAGQAEPVGEDTITVHAIRADRTGSLWFQLDPSDKWSPTLDPNAWWYRRGWIESERGPTRPVRIAGAPPARTSSPPATSTWWPPRTVPATRTSSPAEPAPLDGDQAAMCQHISAPTTPSTKDDTNA